MTNQTQLFGWDESMVPDEKKSKEAVAKVKKKKATVTPMTPEELKEKWVEIIRNPKNSKPDQERLEETWKAWKEGKIHPQTPKLSKAEALRMYARLNESQKEQKLIDMVKNTPDNYFLIQTEEQLAKLIAELDNEPIVAIDTETTGVDVYTDVMVGLSITLPSVHVIPAIEKGKHVYIPVDHAEGEQLEREYVLAKLDSFLRDENTHKVLHNAMFDIAIFRRHGSDLLGVSWDTMTAMHLLNENEESFKLKDLAPKYLGAPADTFASLFGKNAQFREVPLDIALVYAGKDTHLTWKLYEFQLEHMKKFPTIYKYYTEVEVPILYVIVAMEGNGYVLDMDLAKEYGNKLHQRADELRESLIERLMPFHEGDEEINLNSSQQMRPALSKAVGKELPNMDAKRTLKPLGKKFPLVADLLEYKKIVKLSGTYIDALPTKQNPTTKRWHSRFNPMGTVTGRFSSGKDEEDKTGQGFNVQNQPQEARPMFVAPEGKVLIGADFKAQEIRCVAYLSGEPVLIDAFLEERDPYASMASTFYKRPYEEVYKNEDGSDTKERKQMKVVWLATLYGMSDFSLADMLGVDKKEAQDFKEELFGSMPKLSAWLKDNNDFSAEHGYVWADKQARKRRLPDARLALKKIPYGKWGDPKFEEARKHNARVNRAKRQATNARVQGSSAVQTKVTMIRAHEYCSAKPGWHLWATVHDEIIFEAPEDFTEQEAEEVRDIMVNSYRWGDVVPNGTDIEVMREWGNGVPVEDWFANKGEK